MHTLTLTDREIMLLVDVLFHEVSTYKNTLETTKWNEREPTDYANTRAAFREVANLEQRVSGVVTAAIDAGHQFPFSL